MYFWNILCKIPQIGPEEKEKMTQIRDRSQREREREKKNKKKKNSRNNKQNCFFENFTPFSVIFFFLVASIGLFRFPRSKFYYTGPRQANLVLIAYASSEGSGEPAHPLLAHTSSESRGNLRQKVRSLAPLNGWACAVKICHDGMLEDTNSLDGAHTDTAN